MAINASLSLTNASAVSKTFTENKRSGYRVERHRVDTSLAMPSVMVIDHSVSKTNGVTSNRHLIQVATSESNGNGGKATIVVNLTTHVPADAPNGAALAKDALAFIANFILTAGVPNSYFDAILQNQS